MPDDTPVADLAKVLAHRARLRSVALAQSIESEHLRTPKTAGAITREVDRPCVCYALNRPALAPLGKRTANLMPDSRACCIPVQKETA